jgi:hypothetical protein
MSLLVCVTCIASCGGGSASPVGAAPIAPAVSRPAFWYDPSGRFVLTARVNPNALPTDAWFEWGTDAGLAVSSASQVQSVGSGTAHLVLEHPLAGLAPGTPVYYRLAAKNDAGITRGPIDRIVPSMNAGRDNVSINELTFELDMTAPPLVSGFLGVHQVDEVTDDRLVFNTGAGNLSDPVLYDRETNNFNFDGLYKVSAFGSEYYFRFGDQAYDNGHTNFLLLKWANGARPPGPGQMTFEIARKEIRQQGTKEFSCVGDSITWALVGESYRKRLVRRNPDLRFVGSRTDIFGFGHEGEGGNTTRDLIARMNGILPGANYLLLIGTNDLFPENETLENIKTIVAALLGKGDRSTVYVMTILPKTKDNDERNQRVNELLREWHAQTTDERIRLIDTEKTFRSLTNWRDLFPDGVHPDANGYAILVETVDNNLQ